MTDLDPATALANNSPRCIGPELQGCPYGAVAVYGKETVSRGGMIRVERYHCERCFAVYLRWRGR